jgi:hypothetical protein
MTERSAQIIRPAPISVAPSKMFTYPTRLADAWAPSNQEIHLPGYEISPPPIEVAVHSGSTRLLEIRQKHSTKEIIKNLYKQIVPEIQMVGECIYDSRYEIDDNIAHVLDSVVSPVLFARKLYPTITVILRARASAMAQEVFKLLGIPTICTNGDVAGRLIQVRQPSGRAKFEGEGLYSSAFRDVLFERYNPTTPERIFISRRGTRRLLNEAEIVAVLAKYGFQTVYFEDIPVCEQWSLTRNAKAIVGIHGAALSSLYFNRNVVKVIELFHPGYVTKWIRQITNAAGGTWCGVTGQLPPDIIKHLDYKQGVHHFHFHDIRIDITSLQMALRSLQIC